MNRWETDYYYYVCLTHAVFPFSEKEMNDNFPIQLHKRKLLLGVARMS